MQYVWHPPRQVVVTKVRQMAADAKLSMEQFIAMETTIQATWKSAGDALRIKFQAMPQVWRGAILGGMCGTPAGDVGTGSIHSPGLGAYYLPGNAVDKMHGCTA